MTTDEYYCPEQSHACITNGGRQRAERKRDLFERSVHKKPLVDNSGTFLSSRGETAPARSLALVFVHEGACDWTESLGGI